ncbi:hypothetical protein ACO0RG_001102 [Hanseniaspora osmophila]|uniref:diacylglycerol cholinephosphotransferase n=1 Tax=Hanseniaspora osmophila TaxID=56408 RepID=A0A1E5RP38_9ASCO|nr:Cholinephosphotransferase 1 [Hanseniaspora osmophila]
MGYYVPHQCLPNLKKYKYSSEDRSLISKNILKPFWGQFVKIFPLWMAPNVITLLGFGFIVVNFLTCLYFDPTLTKEHPRWAYFSYAFGLFMYQTFDACDGGHARRTGQSGPLGELFDHCIDSLNTTVSMLIFCAVSQLGFTFPAIFAQFALLCNFYLSTWEEFHTHTLFLSEFSGPVEGILLIITSFILTGILGPQFVWHYPIAKIAGLQIESFHVLFGLFGLALLFNIYYAQKNVADYYQKNKLEAHMNDPELAIASARAGLIPFFAFFAVVFVLCLIEPQFISLPFVLSNGLAIAFTVGRIIVAHLTMQDYPWKNSPLFLPLAQLIAYQFFTSVVGYNASTVCTNLCWMGFGLALGVHATFLNDIIFDFTSYLDIYALSIKHPKIH